MSHSRIARNYADALLANEANAAELVAQWASVCDILAQSSDLRAALESPVVSSEARAKAVAVLSKQLNLAARVTKLLERLVGNGRGAMASAVLTQAQALLDAREGRTHVVIESAREWPVAERGSFEQSLGLAKARFEWLVIKDLIGGVRVRIGDRIWDGSVRKQLRTLQSVLVR